MKESPELLELGYAWAEETSQVRLDEHLHGELWAAHAAALKGDA